MTTLAESAFPIDYDVEPQIGDRNRLASFFRIILAIPHLILVGGPGLAFGFGFWPGDRDFNWLGFGGAGVLGTVAFVMAIISWFAIVFTGKDVKGLWDFKAMFFRWRSKSMAYAGLLRDEYPPFGDGDYPVRLELGQSVEERDRLSVAFRLILLIPHVIVLFFVGIAWAITVIIAWFAILFTGSYPESLYRFGVGYMRWSLRVETYALLMHDRFPPFSLE